MRVRMTPPRHDPEELLLHDGFVRALAHALMRDAHRAEDVAHEAMLVLALARRGPADEGSAGSVRAWLAAVAHKLAGKARRGDASGRTRIPHDPRGSCKP